MLGTNKPPIKMLSVLGEAVVLEKFVELLKIIIHFQLFQNKSYFTQQVL